MPGCISGRLLVRFGQKVLCCGVKGLLPQAGLFHDLPRKRLYCESTDAPDNRPARTPTRERILAVAHDAIIAKGFDATSVDEIAAAVEISRTGFFYHFSDKNALARAVIEGGIILARGLGDPQVLVRKVLLAGQMVKAVYQKT